MPTPRPILTCTRCGHDLADLITTPWIRTCPECGTPFNPDFIYDGMPPERPEPNPTPTKPNPIPNRNDSREDPREDTEGNRP